MSQNPLNSGLVNQGVNQVLGQGHNPLSQGHGQGLNPLNQLGQGHNPLSQGLGQGLNPLNQGLGQGHNPLDQVLGQGHNPLSQGLGQGLNPLNQGLGQGHNPLNQGLGQAVGNVLSQPQGEVSGLLGPGIPQNAQNLVQGMIDPTRAGTSTGLATGAGAGALGAGALGAHGAHGQKVKTKGTVNFRPIEARFNQDKDVIGKMDPYCKFKIGFHSGKSTVAKSEGTHPTWGDVVPVKYKGQQWAKIKVKDKDTLRPDSRLGSVKIPLDQVVTGVPNTQWYPLEKRGGKVTGEIQIEITYTPAI